MQELFKKYLENQCSPDEVKLFLREVEKEENKEIFKNLIDQQFEAEQELSVINENELQNILKNTYQDIRNRINVEKKIEAEVMPLGRRTWFRIAAAAVFVLVVAGIYFLVNKSTNEQPVTKNDTPANDIVPGGNKASLTLVDGSNINLESAANGKIAQQGSAEISKLNDGRITYNSLNEKPTEVLYNSVITPRGGQYQVTLADGSKVWLNSASSIRFPASFAANERNVEITGEVYFEVAKDVSRPFKINVAGKEQVQVLGTHFNINCYTDETSIKTTLIEGSIEVTSITSQKSQLIVPGQQARLNNRGEILVDKAADLDNVMAWKNGYFNFDGADTKTVMRLLSRWYDIDVDYEGSVPEREFGGEIEKNLDFSQVLKLLEKNNLHFRLEGRKLVITP